MLTVKKTSEAAEIILSSLSGTMPDEQAPVTLALGRTLAFDLTAKEFVPDFDRSTVDGYAVMASDTFGCGESTPAMLRLTGEVEMGIRPNTGISKGECVYVPTGGEIPQGADAMVMIEYAEDYGDEYRYIMKPSAPGAHIVYKGDDVKPGKTVLEAGHILRAQDIGVLAALGYEFVDVRRKPRAGIISTGDELVGVNDSLRGAQVRDINSYTLYAGMKAAGAEPVMYGICPDDYETLKQKVKQAALECDLLLISGGSSVGVKDTTQKIIEELSDSGVLLHGMAVKPGKPTIYGLIGGKPVFGLPGHPVSAFFIFNKFVRPLITAMLGAKEPIEKRIKATLAANLPSNQGREEYVNVRLVQEEKGLCAVPVYGKSGLISVLAEADGYIRIDRDCEGLSAGAEVDVLLL